MILAWASPFNLVLMFAYTRPQYRYDIHQNNISLVQKMSDFPRAIIYMYNGLPDEVIISYDEVS